jgi:hypothetical protein
MPMAASRDVVRDHGAPAELTQLIASIRTSTELMLTFPPPSINAVSVMPLDSEETGGRFRVWLHLPTNPSSPTLVWDRKIEGACFYS